VFGCRLADRIEIAAVDRDSLIDVVSVEFLLEFGLEFRAFGALDPERITRNERFAEND